MPELTETEQETTRQAEQARAAVRVRAKFRCISETRSAYAPAQDDNLPVTYRFQAMYDPDLPEDQRYAKYTPSGSLEMLVDNPSVQFELGKDYYLDFTPVPEDAA